MFFEVYFIPGTSFIGMIGALITIVAIVLVFRRSGNFAGTVTLFISLIFTILLIVFGSGNKVWQRMSNQNFLSARANMIEQDEIKPGMTGIAVTALKPRGTGRFNDENYIVQTDGEKIQKGSRIEVIRVNVTKIIVKSVNIQG
jgi:membrane-bound ClpP family serine protease